jgi:hypothetical protein
MNKAISGIVVIIILAAVVGNLDLVVKYLNGNPVKNGFAGLRGQ